MRISTIVLAALALLIGGCSSTSGKVLQTQDVYASYDAYVIHCGSWTQVAPAAGALRVDIESGFNLKLVGILQANNRPFEQRLVVDGAPLPANAKGLEYVSGGQAQANYVVPVSPGSHRVAYEVRCSGTDLPGTGRSLVANEFGGTADRQRLAWLPYAADQVSGR